MNNPINKKEIIRKLKVRLSERGVAREEINELSKKFDVLVEALRERLTTQFVTKVEDLNVKNLESEIDKLIAKGLPMTNIDVLHDALKDLKAGVEITNFKDFPAEIKISNFPEQKEFPQSIKIEGAVKVEPQDQTPMFGFITEALGTLVSFLGKLAGGVFKTKMIDEDFLKPQTFALYNPYTKKYINPDELFKVTTHVNGGPSISVNGGGQSQPIPSVPVSGQTVVTTSGTRVQLGTGTALSLTIKALAGNTGKIYVGGSNVTSSNGFELSAGDSVSSDLGSLNPIWIDSSVNGEGVSFFYVK